MVHLRTQSSPAPPKSANDAWLNPRVKNTPELRNSDSESHWKEIKTALPFEIFPAGGSHPVSDPFFPMLHPSQGFQDGQTPGPKVGLISFFRDMDQIHPLTMSATQVSTVTLHPPLWRALWTHGNAVHLRCWVVLPRCLTLSFPVSLCASSCVINHSTPTDRLSRALFRRSSLPPLYSPLAPPGWVRRQRTVFLRRGRGGFGSL